MTRGFSTTVGRARSREVSVKDRVYRLVKAAILTLELKPGDHLVESGVAKQYGTSRIPAREALSLLVNDGLLEVIPRKGYFVTPVRLQDVLENYHLRILLEPEAAALAALRAPSTLVSTLQRNTEFHAETPTVHLNREFHVLTARASGNSQLARRVDQLFDEVQRVVALDFYIHIPHHAAHEHWPILAAIRDQNSEAARQSMLSHLENSRDRILESFQFRGADSTSTLQPLAGRIERKSENPRPAVHSQPDRHGSGKDG